MNSDTKSERYPPYAALNPGDNADKDGNNGTNLRTMTDSHAGSIAMLPKVWSPLLMGDDSDLRRDRKHNMSTLRNPCILCLVFTQYVDRCVNPISVVKCSQYSCPSCHSTGGLNCILSNHPLASKIPLLVLSTTNDNSFRKQSHQLVRRLY